MTTDPTTISGDLAALFAAATRAEASDIEYVNIAESVLARTMPNDHKVELLDLEQHREHPRRAHGSVTLDQSASFVVYVNRFANEATIAYVQPDGPRVVAHLNDHRPLIDEDTSLPGWADWKATLAWRTTLPWKHWLQHDRQMLSQEAFAEHIEEGLRSIVDPDAATLLEIAQTFKAEMSAQIAQARRLSNGEVRLTWNESIDARAGRDGELIIPDKITLALAPFEGAERIIVDARLRYRLSGGSEKKLTIGYLLDNPQQILRDAVDREVGVLRDQLDEAVTIVYGTRE